jgi:hypothetical protein
MLEFVADEQWLAFVPVLAVAEYLAIGLMICVSCRHLFPFEAIRSSSSLA